jgi:hypothetical protein
MKLFLLFIQLMPAAIDAIKAVEAAIPESGKGAEKLAMFRGVMQAGFDLLGDLRQPFEQLWPSLEALASVIVKGLNSVGVFKK